MNAVASSARLSGVAAALAAATASSFGSSLTSPPANQSARDESSANRSSSPMRANGRRNSFSLFSNRPPPGAPDSEPKSLEVRPCVRPLWPRESREPPVSRRRWRR